MATTFRDLIEPFGDDSFDKPAKYYVRYPYEVSDDYGQHGYYFRTLRGAQVMARRAFKARPGDVIALSKDWGGDR